MASDREQQIRERAYRIWEEEGRPTGRNRENWQRAETEIADEEALSRSISEGGAPSGISSAA
jgi:hypothetical protein